MSFSHVLNQVEDRAVEHSIAGVNSGDAESNGQMGLSDTGGAD